MVGKMVKAPDLTSDAVRKASDADLAAIISKGKGKMPGFDEKVGGEAGVTKVLAYLRSLAK
jgi:hypothetical protein